MAEALTAAGVNLKHLQLLGTGLWDDPRGVRRARPCRAAGYAAPDPSASAAFSGRYRARFGDDPVRTATLAYDAVALVAALVRDAGGAAVSPRGADQSVGLCRHRRRVPLPRRRHQRARPRRHEGGIGRQHAGRGIAEELWRVTLSPRPPSRGPDAAAAMGERRRLMLCPNEALRRLGPGSAFAGLTCPGRRLKDLTPRDPPPRRRAPGSRPA